METAYFICYPFTQIGKSAEEMLKRRLDKLTLLQPKPGAQPEKDSASWFNHIHLKEDIGEKIIRATEEYRKWALLHGGEQIATYGRLLADSFMPQKEQASQIRSDLLRRLRKQPDTPVEAREKTAEDRILNGGIFLNLAEIHDHETEETDLELKELLSMENQMMENLRRDDKRVEPSMDTAEKTKRTDPGKWMPETRLRAWSTLFCFVQNQISRQSIPIFITFSEAVFNHAEDLLPNGRKIMNADFLVLNGKKNQMEAGRFYEAVEQWLKDHPFTPQQTDPVLRTGNLDLFVVQAHPMETISHLARLPSGPGRTNEKARPALTIMGLIRE